MKKLIAVTLTVVVIFLLTGSAFAYTNFDMFFTGEVWGMTAKQIIEAEQTTEYTYKTLGDLQEISFKPNNAINYQYYLRNDKLIAGVCSGLYLGNKKEKEIRYSMLLRNCNDRFGTEWALTKKEINTVLSDIANGLGIPKKVTNVNKYTKDKKAWYNEDKTVFVFLNSKYECKIFFLSNPDMVK